MARMRRTHYCGELGLEQTGQRVCLTGWVHRRRTFGGLVFIDLRDRSGIVQTVFSPAIAGEARDIAEGTRGEFVLAVSGVVRERVEGDFLFHLDAASGAELSGGRLGDALRAAFQSAKHALSEEAELISRPDQERWIITDQVSDKSYVIKPAEGQPAVYHGTVNLKRSTGFVELAGDAIEILNTAATPPFVIEDEHEATDELRLRYRYLDLRRPRMQKIMHIRHKAALAARKYMDEMGFLEIDTPILMNSTPEGARDFLVPSRHNPGRFYALPQSPQQFKQILMMSGVDRYFQVARCFRDEDVRADRVFELTQLDVEMSFATREDILEIGEGLVQRVFQEAAGIKLETPLRRMSYNEAMSRYGSDRPDTRFGLELQDFSQLLASSGFQVFDGVVAAGGQVKGIVVPGGATFSRKVIDDLTERVRIFGAKGLVWIKATEKGVESSAAKFIKPELLAEVCRASGANTGDIILLVADKPAVVADSLGNLRVHLGRTLDLIDKSRFDVLWVIDFPMFLWNEEDDRYEPSQHMFTMVPEEDLPLLDTDPGKARGLQYDLVINGVECAGGSIRIHQWEIQKKIFEIIKVQEADVVERFGYFVEALRYGTPPHGGFAAGLDRLVMLMTGEENIRDVVAFPKTARGLCLLTGAPSVVTEEQLKELSIRVVT